MTKIYGICQQVESLAFLARISYLRLESWSPLNELEHMQRYMCVILRRRQFDVKILITLQNVRSGQPFLITLVQFSC